MGGKKKNEVSKMQGQIGRGKVNSFSDRISDWNSWRIPQSSVLESADKRSSEFFKHSFPLVKKQMITEFYKNSNIHGEFWSHLFSASRIKISKHDLRCAAAPPQVAMCSCKLWCAFKIQFGKMCDVFACRAFLGVPSAIAILASFT